MAMLIKCRNLLLLEVCRFTDRKTFFQCFVRGRDDCTQALQHVDVCNERFQPGLLCLANDEYFAANSTRVLAFRMNETQRQFLNS